MDVYCSNPCQMDNSLIVRFLYIVISRYRSKTLQRVCGFARLVNTNNYKSFVGIIIALLRMAGQKNLQCLGLTNILYIYAEQPGFLKKESTGLFD